MSITGQRWKRIVLPLHKCSSSASMVHFLGHEAFLRLCKHNYFQAASAGGWRKPQQLDSSSSLSCQEEAPDSWGGSRPSCSNGRGHQMCALEYQEASQKCLLQGCQL